MTWFPLWGKEPGLIHAVRWKGLATLVTGPDNKASKAAALRQAQLQKQQEAVQARAKLREDERETDISGQLASQRRAVAARRRGGQLAFAGPNTGLKTTFGG